jgi:hypothetical protein
MRRRASCLEPSPKPPAEARRPLYRPTRRRGLERRAPHAADHRTVYPGDVRDLLVRLAGTLGGGEHWMDYSGLKGVSRCTTEALSPS